MSTQRDPSEYQLPKHVVPTHYEIRLQPDFTSFLFTGHVVAHIRVHQVVSQITVHSLGLKITDAYVVDDRGTRLNALKTTAKVTFIDPGTGDAREEEFESAASLDDKAQTATFTFAGALAQGKWRLVAEYEGSMVQPSLEGFYRSKWTDDAKVDHWLAATQFEATHARRAFPCWDEPAIKVTTDLTLVVDKHLTALSNMRQSCMLSQLGKKTITFATTPKMSTYLLAWCIGEFESSEPVWANGKEIRIWSVPGKNDFKSYALKCAKYGVEWYERKLRVPYFGGDKIDMIAIPDFRSGAMENTGLITYRATALLVDERHATVAELQRVAEVVFHELAHQWFGNLVTMAWWDGLPLNESNATIFGYLVSDDFQPEWRIFNSFGISRASAFALDALRSTHPCWAPVGHPDEVEERFDRITYEKGGSVEYQMHQFLGADLFYDGACLYLQRFGYGSTQVTDLWDAIEAGARQGGLDVPVRQIMDAWFLNEGHPVVTVSRSDKPGYIKLTQERFAFLGEESHAQQLWPIPLCLRYATADGAIQEKKFVFCEREQEVFIGEDFQSVVANAGGSGFYRVRYSPDLLDKLLAKPFENLEVIERYNLVNDSWALVRAHKLSIETYLGLVRKLAGEKDPNVWNIISGSLHALHGLTSGEHRAAFAKLVRELAKPIFNDLGWTAQAGESPASLELRGSLAALLGTVGQDFEVQAKSVELFESWKSDRDSVDPNIVPALVSALAYTGDQARFDEFIALSRAARTDQEKLRFLMALGKFRKPELYSAAISMMLEQVKTDEAPLILGAFLGIEGTGEAAWEAIQINWEKIVKKFPPSHTARMIGGCSALDTPELQAQVEAFFAEHKVEKGDMAVAQMLDRLRVNARLRQTETARLQAYLIPPATASAVSQQKPADSQ